MAKPVARGQVTINTLSDAYTINQSIKEYVYQAENNGTILNAISFTSTITVTQGGVAVTGFTIGAITKPNGFSTITVNNANKTIVYTVAANTNNLAESGTIVVPVIIDGMTYNQSFYWAKARKGDTGQDAYTINSSRLSYVIATEKDGRIVAAVTTTTVITALKGTTAITSVIGTLPTVAGCTLSKSGTTVTFVFNAGTSLADNGVIDIPVTVDGKNFTVSFSWAKAKTGANGVDSNMLDWVSDWNNNKTLIDAETVITPKIFAGTKNSNGTITGIAIGKFVLGTMNASGTVTFDEMAGIYGFNAGYKTFGIDIEGNVQIGKDNQVVRYNAATGKIEFGSEVSLNWVSLINTAKTEAINSAATDATNKVNNIRVGIRNYIKYSIFNSSNVADYITTEGVTAEIDTNNKYLDFNSIKITQTAVVGTSANTNRAYFTGIKICNPASFSMWVKCSAASKLRIKIGSAASSDQTIDSTWRLIKVENVAATVNGVFFGATNAGVTFWVALPMLVEGTKATDWNPSPDEVSVNIAEALNIGSRAQDTADEINRVADTERWATKLTYIDANGIFTGTLSANTVNAVTINASQIAAGTIDAARIDVNSLKATLITAANINALTLTVNKGTIGGWTVDADSVYRGTKNNTSGAFTAASGAITIGSNGIRGFKWRMDATGAGAVAGGNIAWDAAGNVTFGASVSIRWEAKLSYIDGDGVYTGLLSADTVNTININASQIIAGTIDAARIDVETLKATLITAANINALTLTTTKGKIGNWNIGTDNISIGTFNGVGQIPMQLRSTSTGSGIWYSGAYKPYGLSLLWYQTSNAGHIVFGQIAATGSSVKTGFIGIQMMAWDNTEYFCLSANYTKSGSKEVYNRIAGWGFDNANIWKNNVYLGADGSITNSTRWKLNNDGSGSLANGNIAWDASGNVTFAETVSIAWTKIGTYIDANGVYTGTLTAAQINAVNIDAGSIKTGTLSADRIAAGSINSTKLEANSIKANIINVAYINGLSCTFDKGKIGGWSIGADNLSIGTLGTVGQTPVQIRSVGAGSGYWYTGEYKPYGLTLTWYQTSNAGHLVFGQVAATGNTVRTGFMGIQMMSWDNLEYFCLSANTTRSGSKEVYNRIAGWAFDNTRIWKNNVSLGADGAISNSSRWSLNNDGSGRVANGNITWDAAGNVSFGASVALNWQNDATAKSETAKELALAMAFGRMLYRDPTFYNGINSVNVYNNDGNGTVTITRTADSTAPNDSKYVLVIKNTGASSPYCGGFNFATNTSYRKVFITRIIAKIPVGRDITFHSNSMGTGGSQKWLTPTAGAGDWCEYICKVTCGTDSFSSTNFFAITGELGTTAAPMEWRVAYATTFDVTSTERYTTTIDANGIYTGTLSAGQIKVDTALVVGGSSYNGSISVRDASNNVKVTLDRAGINAVGGVIAGWNITGSYIYKNSVYLGEDGTIYNGSRWRLGNDGSGYVANGNMTWDAAGQVTFYGTIYASAGRIGNFEIGYGRIGSTASGSGSGGGLAIYDDLFRVGNTTSYAMFGGDTIPSSAGGSFTATGRITNTKSNSYFTNCGIYIDVRYASKNYGIFSNAALYATSMITTKIKSIYFTGSGYDMNFAQYNMFFIYASSSYGVTLPTEAQVKTMFNVSSLDSEFGVVFTLVYNYYWSNRLTINGVRDNNGNVINHAMEKGDVVTLLCAAYPSFHYQIISRMA